MTIYVRFLSLLLFTAANAPLLAADTDKRAFPKNEEFKRVNDKIKEVSGTAEFLRSVPKHFATLKAIDVPRRRGGTDCQRDCEQPHGDAGERQ